MNTTIEIKDILNLINSVHAKHNLTLFSDCGLLLKVHGYAQAKIIIHLGEIAERRLYLERGFSSMFDYCHRGLHFEPGEIWLRTQVSSCCRKFPELLVELANCSINLTVAGKVCAHLTPENKVEIIEFCRGKTARKVEEYLANRDPKPSLPHSLRRQNTPVVEIKLPLDNDYKSAPIFASEKDEPTSEPEKTPPLLLESKPTTPARIEILGAERYHLRCAISADLRKKIDRLAELLGISNPVKDLALLLEKAIDCTLKQKDPAQPKRAKKAPSSTEKTVSAEENDQENVAPRSRYITAETRRIVYQRANYQCQYCALEGVRCGQRTHLTIDHKIPFARGGSNSAENLQILCSAHNSSKAEIDFGFRWQAPPKKPRASEAI